MRITIDEIIGFIAVFLGAAFLVWMLAWADQREHELGISGMSSERILVADELRKK